MIEIRRGVTRTVLLTRRWAIKVPRFHLPRDHNKKTSRWGTVQDRIGGMARGYLANLSEAEWSDSPSVCPVKRSLLWGWINIHPRCEPYRPDEPPYTPLSDEERAQIGFCFPTDAKISNVGLLDGRLVWIDYDNSWNDHPPTCPEQRSWTGFRRCDEQRSALIP